MVLVSMMERDLSKDCAQSSFSRVLKCEHPRPHYRELLRGRKSSIWKGLEEIAKKGWGEPEI
jgi:hypothetical protein